MSTRRATHAGSWYEAKAEKLAEQLQGWLDAAEPSAGRARAVIAPVTPLYSPLCLAPAVIARAVIAPSYSYPTVSLSYLCSRCDCARGGRAQLQLPHCVSLASVCSLPAACPSPARLTGLARGLRLFGTDRRVRVQKDRHGGRPPRLLARAEPPRAPTRLRADRLRVVRDATRPHRHRWRHVGRAGAERALREDGARHRRGKSPVTLP
jgi:hypothetical protein